MLVTDELTTYCCAVSVPLTVKFPDRVRSVPDTAPVNVAPDSGEAAVNEM